MNSGRKFLFIAIALICLAVLIWWSGRNIAFQDVFLALKGIPKTGLVSVLVLNVVAIVIYGLRMSILANTGFVPAFATVWLGFGLNGMLPLRLGDLAKIVYARQLFGIPTSRLTAATAIEKLFDLGAVLILGLVTTQFVSFAGIQSGMRVLALLVVVGLLGLIAIFALQKKWHAAEQRIFLWLRAFRQSVVDQTKGKSPIIVGLYTGFIWGITVVATYVMFASIHSGFGWTDACLLTLILVLAVSIPGAPAGLGVVEAGIVGYLHTMLKIDITQAIASALAFHLAAALPQIAGATAILVWAALRSRLHRKGS